MHRNSRIYLDEHTWRQSFRAGVYFRTKMRKTTSNRPMFVSSFQQLLLLAPTTFHNCPQSIYRVWYDSYVDIVKMEEETHPKICNYTTASSDPVDSTEDRILKRGDLARIIGLYVLFFDYFWIFVYILCETVLYCVECVCVCEWVSVCFFVWERDWTRHVLIYWN